MLMPTKPLGHLHLEGETPQENLDRNMREWAEGRDAKRDTFFVGVVGVKNVMLASVMATQEEGAYLALLRGENTLVVSDVKQYCDTCSKTAGDPYRCTRGTIWFGSPKGWVCEVCATSMEEMNKDEKLIPTPSQTHTPVKMDS
jgi:hypothetical protein